MQALAGEDGYPAGIRSRCCLVGKYPPGCWQQALPSVTALPWPGLYSLDGRLCRELFDFLQRKSYCLGYLLVSSNMQGKEISCG